MLSVHKWTKQDPAKQYVPFYVHSGNPSCCSCLVGIRATIGGAGLKQTDLNWVFSVYFDDLVHFDKLLF